jgi:hypothetical protein
MTSFNPNLAYFVERLQGFSTNTFRLETQNKTTAKQNDIISFDLPSNAILNLRSLKVWCNASCDSVASGGSATAGARLPPIDDLVERIEVSVGGVILSQGTNFQNVLNEAQKAVQVEYCDSVVAHPEYVRQTSYVNGLGAGATVLSTTKNEDYPADPNLSRFCITKFHGFLASADPKLLDTSIIADIRVRLYMASDNVLTTSAGTGLGSAASGTGFETGFCAAGGTGGGKYVLTDIHATIEAIGLASNSYDEMIAAQMGQQGFLEIPYKSYTSFQEIHSGSTRFTVSCQSLDRVWVAWRKTTFNAQAAPITVSGHKIQGGYLNNAINAGYVAPNVDIGIPQYDSGGVLDTNNEKYKSQYFNFVAPANDMKMQLQLNGAYMPQFSANLGELYGMTRNSLQGARDAKNMSLDQYLNNYCVQCFRLNMPDSEYSRSISGLDTRSVNLQGIVRTEGTGASSNLAINVFTEQTSTMRVGAGRAIEILN